MGTLYSLQKERLHNKRISGSAVNRLMRSKQTYAGFWKGTVYPSGDVTIGRVPQLTAKESERKYERCRNQYMTSKDYYVDENGKECSIPWNESSPDYETVSRYIGSSNVNNLKRERKRYGIKGITGYGKRMLRSGARILQDKYGCRNCCFATFTIPTVGPESRIRINTSWSRVCNRLVNRIRGKLRSLGLDTYIVYCTELQDRRSFRYGGVYPHLHMVWRAKTPRGDWVLSANELRLLWSEILDDYIVNELPDFSASVDCQLVKKSVSGYLGKYISKGTESIQDAIDSGYEEELPKTWWGMTSSLRSEIKRLTFSISDPLASIFVNDGQFLRSMGYLSYYSQVICTGNDGRQVIRGVVAQFAPSILPNLSDFLNLLCPDWYLGIAGFSESF